MSSTKLGTSQENNITGFSVDFPVSSQQKPMTPVDSRRPSNVRPRSQDLVNAATIPCTGDTVKDPSSRGVLQAPPTIPLKKIKLTSRLNIGDRDESESVSEQENVAESSSGSRTDLVLMSNHNQKIERIQLKENTGSENRNVKAGEHTKEKTVASSQYQTSRPRSRTIPKKLAHLSPEQREEKRNRQNFQERNRMGNLTNAFHRLAEALPAHLQKENMTKILTLRNAKIWIRQLRAMLRNCDSVPSSGEQHQQQHLDQHRFPYQQHHQMGQCVYSAGMDEGIWCAPSQAPSPLSVGGELSSFDSGVPSFHSTGIPFSPHNLCSMTPSTTPAPSPSIVTAAGDPLFLDSPQTSYLPHSIHPGTNLRAQCIAPSPCLGPFHSGEFTHSTPAGRPARQYVGQTPWTSLDNVTNNFVRHPSWASTSPTEDFTVDSPVRSCMSLRQEPHDYVSPDVERVPPDTPQGFPRRFFDRNTLISPSDENIFVETQGRESHHASGQELWMSTPSTGVSTSCFKSDNFGWNDSSGYVSISVNDEAESSATRVAGSEWRSSFVSSRDWLETTACSSWPL